MVSVPDYPRRSNVLHDLEFERPRKRRFRFLAALAAPFQDMDDRALHKKRGQVDVRNNSKGNLFVSGAAARAEIPVRRFQRGDD
jgi:hypothetical protein